MMRTIIFSILTMFCLTLVPSGTSAQSNFFDCISGEIGNEACYQVLTDDEVIGIEAGTGDSAKDNLKGTVRTFVNYLLGFLGLICVIILMWAGVVYIFSLGDDARLTTAKNIIIWSVVGILVIVFAYPIVNTLFTEFAPDNVG